MGEDSKEIKITYETLYEILRREKSKDELQKLDEPFFRDVLDYLREKASIVQEAAGKFDMFSVEEKENTQNQLNNIRRILKELYARREKKIIEMALNKSKTNSNIIDTTNLLAKEHELYNETVKTLDSFRKNILLALLDLKTPEIAQQSPPEPIPEPPTPEPEPVPPEPIPQPPAPEPASDKLKVKFLQNFRVQHLQMQQTGLDMFPVTFEKPHYTSLLYPACFLLQQFQ